MHINSLRNIRLIGKLKDLSTIWHNKSANGTNPNKFVLFIVGTTHKHNTIFPLYTRYDGEMVTNREDYDIVL